ncbi:glycosyltransferase family 2 protein [Vibrio vulnificus]|nr:glycosyltransferase family 2 protein [Vibrio vulnificus]
MESIKIAIVIPAFNEEKSIGNVILELRKLQVDNVEIIVVNDFSKDKTSEVSKESGAHVVNLHENVGYAKAIEKGLSYASTIDGVKYLLTMDADGQHDPRSVLSIIELARETRPEVIAGVRSKNARISEWCYSKYFKYKFSVEDPLCGLKLYSVDFYNRHMRFETYDSIGTELLTKALMQGVNVASIPVIIRKRNDDIPRFGHGLSANYRILKSLLLTMCKVELKRL